MGAGEGVGEAVATGVGVGEAVTTGDGVGVGVGAVLGGGVGVGCGVGGGLCTVGLSSTFRTTITVRGLFKSPAPEFLAVSEMLAVYVPVGSAADATVTVKAAAPPTETLLLPGEADSQP